ncbi:hypothetical protein [Yinghuangia seranimata]|uniref:hypothetical protein n=1 Tax=Yinghuangia seranimata TaxID=408067 RepID=UPI00248C947D|nr:hypothetical protein [Yinghuangia seranimata]MDI2132893.1 hypothetical protein [Yinghuangia seranimata]
MSALVASTTKAARPETPPREPAPAPAPRPAAPRPDKPPIRARVRSVPARLRLVTTLATALIAALCAALALGVNAANDNLDTVGHATAPQAATATDLYFSLADMDAQVANVLLVGHDESVGNKQSALRQLRQRRAAVSDDLQALIDRGLDAEGATLVRQLIADLATYDGFTAQARLSDDQILDRDGPGRPPAQATNYYLNATVLLHQDLLPAADRLGRAAEHRLAVSADDGASTTRMAALAVAVLGGAAVLVLAVWQVALARRFRRVFNPALLAATLAVAVVTVLGAGLLTDHGDRVRDAKSQAFDPFATLAHARALASDANADHSRYLILPDRAPAYRAAFAEKSRALALASTSPPLATRLAAFQRDDRDLQTAVTSGRREAAIGMATNVGRGNLAFEFFDYQDVLGDTAAEHRADFDQRVSDARSALDGWMVLPPLVLGVGVLLVLAGVRPRLREYR